MARTKHRQKNNFKDRKLANISIAFERTARQKFPYKSMYEITLELNKMLEEALYNDARKKK